MKVLGARLDSGGAKALGAESRNEAVTVLFEFGALPVHEKCRGRPTYFSKSDSFQYLEACAFMLDCESLGFSLRGGKRRVTNRGGSVLVSVNVVVWFHFRKEQ